MLAAKGIVYEWLNITSCLGQTGFFFFNESAWQGPSYRASWRKGLV